MPTLWANRVCARTRAVAAVAGRHTTATHGCAQRRRLAIAHLKRIGSTRARHSFARVVSRSAEEDCVHASSCACAKGAVGTKARRKPDGAIVATHSMATGRCELVGTPPG